MSMEDENSRSYSRSRPSCTQCQHLKKKCDRRKPQCSLCLRHGRNCSFNLRSSIESETTLTAGSSSSAASPSQDFNSNFPAVFFLDSLLFQRSLSRLPDVSLTIDPVVHDFLGNILTEQAFISNYFSLIHPWMPCLSRKHFMERVINPLRSAQPSNTLLIAAMKLVAVSPPHSNPRSDVYAAVKADLSRAVTCGLFELRIFQAMLLLALYELGHAIHPAAYMTIGLCIRYGNAQGFNLTVEHNPSDALDDIESEERRRSWWAALFLDRFLNIGRAEKSSLVGEPSSDAILPADDSLWEQAQQIHFPLHRLCDPPTATMGRFCLTAQATILLGKVIRNVNDDASQDEFRDREAIVLDNTLAALTNVSLQEGHFRGVGVCSPTTICYSVERAAVQNSNNMATERFYASNVEPDIAVSMLGVTRGLMSTGRCGAEEISPFCLEAMYRSGIFYARQFRNTRNESDLESLETIKTGFTVINNRWGAAGTYLEMLEARILSGIL